MGGQEIVGAGVFEAIDRPPQVIPLDKVHLIRGKVVFEIFPGDVARAQRWLYPEERTAEDIPVLGVTLNAWKAAERLGLNPDAMDICYRQRDGPKGVTTVFYLRPKGRLRPGEKIIEVKKDK